MRAERPGGRVLAWAAGLFLAAVVLAATAAPFVGHMLGLDAETVDLLARLEPPSSAHPMGTDELGRDVLLRLLYAGRISLAVGVVGACLAALIGATVGLVAGYA